MTRGIERYPFGGGQACPVEYTNVINRTDPAVCGISKRCCINEDYKPDNVCKDDGYMTYTLDTSSCDQNGLPDTKEVDCCYVGEWEKGECTGDYRHNMTYTRTVLNGELCTNNESTEKKEPNKDECYSKCEVEQIGGHTGPYEMNQYGYCMGNNTFEVTKAGIGMGLLDISCTGTGARDKPVGEVYTYRRAISAKNVPCPT